jgi:AcrR family transcriptional regulator
VKKSSNRRLKPAVREQLILEEAGRFFAEHGFEGGTSALARRLGISQPLLYRYFPTKDALIERVHQTYFRDRQDDALYAILDDESVAPFERIVGFYRRYIKMHDYQAIRLFLFSSLAGLTLNRTFFEDFERVILTRIVYALREAFGERGSTPITDLELELAWSLHASIYYIALHRHVHGVPGAEASDLVEFKVRLFFEGARAMMTTPVAERSATG